MCLLDVIIDTGLNQGYIIWFGSVYFYVYLIRDKCVECLDKLYYVILIGTATFAV